MEQLEYEFLGESRTIDNEGNILDNTFGYYNINSSKFEKRGLKEHLTDLGIYLDSHEEQSQQLRDYYNKMKQIIKKL